MSNRHTWEKKTTGSNIDWYDISAGVACVGCGKRYTKRELLTGEAGGIYTKKGWYCIMCEGRAT